MEKIGIITLNGYFNFGNRLQNYALQKTLEDLGYEVSTLVVKENIVVDKKNIIEKLKGKSLFDIKESLLIKLGTNDDIKRSLVFKEFSDKYISEINEVIDSETEEKFKAFVVGSDQVWNPNYNTDKSTYFLEFAPKEKRMSYAPSFGVSNIEKDQTDKYRKLIDGIKYLSVREDKGSEIIKDLTGREVDVHVDPTLLISKKDWLKVSQPCDMKPKRKYLLTYFLGGIPSKIKKEIKKIASRNNLEIINLADRRDKLNYVNIGPSEFLDYINSSELFCTDSFHGVVFSIIFKKNFLVFKREGAMDMYSRIDTILSNFSLDSSKFNSSLSDKEIFNVNFSGADKIIEYEKKKSLEYLKTSLDSIKSKGSQNEY